jgi:hypothetical protein
MNTGRTNLSRIEQLAIEAKNTLDNKIKQQREEYAETDISQEAKSMLKNPDLLNILIKETNKFVAGEQESILTVGLNACGRLVKNASRTSYNIIPNDQSGSGKDYVTRNTLNVFVPERYVEFQSRISETAFTYWHTKEAEPEWTWDGKVLYLSDISDKVLNGEVMKVFLSDETKSVIVKDQKAVEFEIEGKPCLFITTARSTPNQELLRRCYLMPLDSSTEQTKRIKQFVANKAITGRRAKYDPVIREAMTGLDRVNVIITYGELLAEKFPDLLISRTAFGTFCDLIKASAALYQFQREKDKNGNVIASLDDYDIAKRAFNKLTSTGLIPITQNQKEILTVINDKLDKNDSSRIGKIHEFWAVAEIEPLVSVSHQGLYKILDALVESKRLIKAQKEIEQSQTDTSGSGTRTIKRYVMGYKIVDHESINLPSREELQEYINSKKEVL